MTQQHSYKALLTDVLSAAHAEEYAGYSKFDALNSPALDALSLKNKWLRILLIQLVKECPFHVRPFLGVQKSRNPKGIALFARAHLFLFEMTGEQQHRDAAENLLDWLLDNRSPAQTNLCWGYNFIWEQPLFLQDRDEPNLVVSTFVGEAFLHAYCAIGKRQYLDSAISVTRFITEDIPVIHDQGEELAIAYVLGSVKAIVLNNNVMAGAFLAKVCKETDDENLRKLATRLVSFTVNRRTEYDAWFYTYPSGKSHIRHDNYHTGGILDGLLEYFESTGDDRFQDTYWSGLEYYRRSLFEKDGAPRWMNDRRYPYDIHGAAQGIVSFAKAARWQPEYWQFAEQVANWTIQNLYRPSTRDFAYRQGRFMKWDYSLMRWCNGWMARALGELVMADPENGQKASPMSTL